MRDVQPDFSMKLGDTRPTLDARATDLDGTTIAIGVSDTVKFSMARVSDGTLFLDEVNAAILGDGAGGVSGLDDNLRYTWASGGTTEAGLFWGEFEVTFSGGGTMTFPNDRRGILINIVEEVS